MSESYSLKMHVETPSPRVGNQVLRPKPIKETELGSLLAFSGMDTTNKGLGIVQ